MVRERIYIASTTRRCPRCGRWSAIGAVTDGEGVVVMLVHTDSRERAVNERANYMLQGITEGDIPTSWTDLEVTMGFRLDELLMGNG